MSSLRHALAGALLCTTLLGGALAAHAAPGQVCNFGQCGSGAAGTVAPASPESQLIKKAERNSWALYESQDGTGIVMESFTDGAKLALIVEKEEVGMVLADPAWDLPAGRTYPIQIAVDGTIYSGTAEASADGKMMVVRGLSRDLLQAFYRGIAAVITVADSRWSFGLQPVAELIDVILTRG